jgi:hypothetical protein
MQARNCRRCFFSTPRARRHARFRKSISCPGTASSDRFGIWSACSKPKQVYIVEGELDVCALVEAGVPVTEILGAHGAKDKPIEGDPIEQPGYAYVVQALPWPIADIYRLSDLPEPAPMALWQPGFEEWERKVILAPRTLSVVTGHPGHGKTTLWNQIWFSVVDR